MSRLRICIPTVAAVAFVLFNSGRAVGQTLTAPQMLQQQEQWTQWAADDTKLQITGRFDGGLGRQFRLATLDIRFNSERGTQLPERMQAGQRLTVSGRLRKVGDRFEFSVSRVVIGETDRQQISEDAAAIADTEPARLFALADQYEAIAQHYNDTDLQSDVTSLRRRALRAQRTLAAKNSEQLTALADKAESLGLDPRTIVSVRFEALAARFSVRTGDRTALLDDIHTQLPGWDDASQTLPPELDQAFLKDAVTTYDKASDTQRRALHRRFYRLVRLPDIQQRLAADGSNGLALASELQTELPEETAAAAMVQTAYVDHKLSQVRQLTRAQLQELSTLLLRHDRHDDLQQALRAWLTVQRDRFEDRGLSGLLRTADEYLFAFEQWEDPEHQQKGIDLLKQAWQLAEKTAPQEAEPIAQRLERFGWTRLHDRWMTTDQVKQLPRTDIELAMREGRVVQGMSPDQVIRTLGEPGRIVRVISSRYVQEVWVFGDSQTSGVSVVMRRHAGLKPQDARVFAVTKSGR